MSIMVTPKMRNRRASGSLHIFAMEYLVTRSVRIALSTSRKPRKDWDRPAASCQTRSFSVSRSRSLLTAGPEEVGSGIQHLSTCPVSIAAYSPVRQVPRGFPPVRRMVGDRSRREDACVMFQSTRSSLSIASPSGDKPECMSISPTIRKLSLLHGGEVQIWAYPQARTLSRSSASAMISRVAPLRRISSALR